MADLRKYKSRWSSTSNSFGTGTGETITPASVTGLPTGNITLTFDRLVTGKIECITGYISGGNFVIVARGVDGTTEQAHTSPTVEMVWNAADWNDAIDAVLVQHTASGTHSTITASSINGNTVTTGTDTVALLTASQTLTNKTLTSPTINTPKITSRVVTTTDDATAEINCDTTDQYQLSAIANATTFTVTGTPTDGQKLIIRFKDAGVAKGLTFTGFTPMGVTIPTTTVAGKWGYVGCIYNLAATTWHVVAVGAEA